MNISLSVLCLDIRNRAFGNLKIAWIVSENDEYYLEGKLISNAPHYEAKDRVKCP